MLHKRGIEKILEGESDAHLGYDKNKKKANENSVMVIQKRTLRSLLENRKYKFQETEKVLLSQ